MIALQGDTIEDHYKTLFYLQDKRHYSVSEIEEMIPFEHEILIAQIMEDIKKKQQKASIKGKRG